MLLNGLLLNGYKSYEINGIIYFNGLVTNTHVEELSTL